MLDGSVRKLAEAARTRLRHPWTPGIRRQPLGTLDFVVVDVETTGWSPDADGITEIGAVRLSGGEVRAEFAALVNPGQPIPPDIVTLTGITDAMVTLAPPVGAVLPGFLDFARGSVLTAHNAPFDVGFLTRGVRRNRAALARPAGAGHGHAGPAAAHRGRGAELQARHPGGFLRGARPAPPSRPGRRPGHRGGAGGPAGPAVRDRHTDPRPAQRGGAGRRATGRPPISPPPRRRVRSPAAEQRYATPEGCPRRRP